MKSPKYRQEESSLSVAQRLLNKKKLTHPLFNEHNKTAEERRLNNFYENKNELTKETKNG